MIGMDKEVVIHTLRAHKAGGSARMIELITSKELMEIFSEVRLEHGAHWGDWIYDEETLSLVIESAQDCPGGYEIDLERSTTATDALAWLAHMLEKYWINDKRIAHLIRAFDDILDLHRLIEQGPIEDIKRYLNERTFLKEKRTS